MLKTAIFLAALLLIQPGRGLGDEQKGPQTAPPPNAPESTADKGKGPVQEKLSVTHHSIRIGERTLKYTATTGRMLMPDESGKPKAAMFFIAYEKEEEGEAIARRPVTFAFNGGPGASSVWLHLGALGPKRVPSASEDKPPPPPYKAIDNQYTWLTFSDLVFIDPVGTGFSRPVPGEEAKQFYGIKEDIRSVGELIRLYTTKYGRWLSPKFIAGESYGTFRAAALTQYLYEKYGMDINGIILISLALDFQTFSPGPGNDLPHVLFLPSYTAAAWYHKKLAPALQEDRRKALDEAERWAMTDYLTALAKGSTLSPEEREKIVQGLMHFTALPRPFIENNNLRIERSDFMDELLRSENRSLGLVDSRATRIGPSAGFLNDPGLAVTVGPYVAVTNDYMKKELDYESDLPYIFLSSEAGSQWSWGSGIKGYPNVLDTLKSAVSRSRHLKVLVACGTYDLDTPYLTAKYTVSHLGLDPQLEKNVDLHCFDGGHMLYTNETSLKELTAEVEAFVKHSIPVN